MIPSPKFGLIHFPFECISVARLFLPFFIILLPFLLRADSSDSSATTPRTPVIVDTDLGDDTDDYWALACALKDPQLDVKLVTTTYGKQQYRGTLIAKFLTAAGRTDIPIGLGAGPDGKGNQQGWLGDFTMAGYHGKVDQDGAQAIIDTINSSPTPVTVIAVGPLNTIGAALKKDPGIAAKANLVAMAGSFHIGYGQKPGQIVEYNVWRDIPDAKAVFSAPWKSIALTPLDTGGFVNLVGDRYNVLLPNHDPLLQTLLSCTASAHGATDPAKLNYSGSGCDLVAVLLAERNPARFTNLEELKIIVDDSGKTNIDPSGRDMKVATTWKDLNGYLDYLDKILLLPTSPAP